MPTRRPLIAGNWKMYKTSSEASDFVRTFLPMVAAVSDCDIMIAPAFTALETVAALISGTPVALGAQNVFWESEGAHTGEVSAGMLAAAGCRYVIIGHSERRQNFGETDESVNRKIRAAIQAGLAPVMCVGETETAREAGETFSVLDRQLKKGLKSFVPEEMDSLVVAYEPVWAIGTGKTATTDQAQEVHRFIRSLLRDLFGEKLALAVRILYGGSVKPENISELMAMADIDGALVGGASLNPDSFGRIVNFNLKVAS
jgi:triosephosphate isomerase (TIM)